MLCERCGLPISFWARISGKKLHPECLEKLQAERSQAASELGLLFHRAASTGTSLSREEVSRLQKVANLDDAAVLELSLDSFRSVVHQILGSDTWTDEQSLRADRALAVLGIDPALVSPELGQIQRKALLDHLQQGRLPAVEAPGFLLEAGEMAHGVFAAQLIEEKVLRRYYQGGYSGFSIPIYKGFRWHVGGFRGHPVVERGVIPTDSGRLALTNRRVLYVGILRSFAIPYKKVLALQGYSDAISVQKDGMGAKPVYFQVEDPEIVGTTLSAAIARFREGGPGPTPLAPPQPATRPVLAVVQPAAPQSAAPLAPFSGSSDILQPYSPIPLRVVGASAEQLSRLRAILDDEESFDRSRRDRILEWLLTTNARVQEIDGFVEEWGARFRQTVNQACEANRDWASAGELDRADIRAGAVRVAAESFEIRVRDLKYEAIADPPSLTATADDDLLAEYGFETMSFYFRHAGDLARVHTVPSDDYERARFEDLLGKGLAKRGSDVSPDGVLGTMTLKEMDALTEGLEHPRFTRRARAIEFLMSVPDLKERLARFVSLRELFQLVQLPAKFSQIDLVALSRSWGFAAEYARLLDITYSTAARAYRVVNGTALDEYVKGWIVSPPFGGCCRTCESQGGEVRGIRSAPRLPHHVGCSCYLSQIYE